MTDYGIVKSNVKPKPIKIDEYSVWVNTDIQPIEEEIDGETFTGFSYHMVQYDKDEYIIRQQEIIDDEITTMMLALCDIDEKVEAQNG